MHRCNCIIEISCVNLYLHMYALQIIYALRDARHSCAPVFLDFWHTFRWSWHAFARASEHRRTTTRLRLGERRLFFEAESRLGERLLFFEAESRLVLCHKAAIAFMAACGDLAATVWNLALTNLL